MGDAFLNCRLSWAQSRVTRKARLYIASFYVVRVVYLMFCFKNRGLCLFILYGNLFGEQAPPLLEKKNEKQKAREADDAFTLNA